MNEDLRVVCWVLLERRYGAIYMVKYPAFNLSATLPLPDMILSVILLKHIDTQEHDP